MVIVVVNVLFFLYTTAWQKVKDKFNTKALLKKRRENWLMKLAFDAYEKIKVDETNAK